VSAIAQRAMYTRVMNERLFEVKQDAAKFRPRAQAGAG